MLDVVIPPELSKEGNDIKHKILDAERSSKDGTLERALADDPELLNEFKEFLEKLESGNGDISVGSFARYGSFCIQIYFVSLCLNW